MLVKILGTLNAIIADPGKYNYEVEHAGADAVKRTVMHNHVKGFGTIACAEDGILPSGG